MDFSQLWDAGGAAIVFGGTLLATVLTCGMDEIRVALGATMALLVRPFSFAKARAEIARDVENMRRDGVLRAHPLASSDREIALVSDALVHDRSLRSALATHEALQDKRARMREKALSPVRQAAEMAPVFGMAGTLFGLSQMRLGEGDNSQMLASMSTAILTTLYGIILANLVFHPLARLLERRMLAEEADRQRLIDWLAAQLAASCPPSRSHLDKTG